MNPEIVKHPLIEHSLHYLRNRETSSARFKHYCHLITTPIVLAATESITTEKTSVQTPLEETDTRHIVNMPVWVPILRAGLGMLKVAQDLFPDSVVGHIGLERDEETARARTYYQKLPDLNERPVVILDPMLATGGSAIHAIEYIKERATPVSLTLACIVAAPEGVEAVSLAHPDVRIITAAVDRQLNEVKYILPGLGDFGDRYFNT